MILRDTTSPQALEVLAFGHNQTLDMNLDGEHNQQQKTDCV